MLRGLAMLVFHVARRFASRHPISAAECDGDCEPVREANVVLDQHQEPTLAAASSHVSTTSSAREGLMLRTKAQSAFVDSKHGERRRRQARFGQVDQIEERTPRQGQGLPSSYSAPFFSTVQAASLQ